MGRSIRHAVVVAAVFSLATPGSAAAYLGTLTVNKCLAGKLQAVGKGTKAYVLCRARDAAHPDAARLTSCLGRASEKITSRFAKLDFKYPSACTAPNGDGPGRDAAAAPYAGSLAANVGSATGKCDAAKQRCVGRYVAAILGCYAKAANKTGAVDNATGGCTAKAASKLVDGVKGCLAKAAAAGDCTNAGSQAAALQFGADAYDDQQACQLDPSAPGCAGVPSSTPTPAPPTPTPTPPFGGGCPGSIVFAPDGSAAANDLDDGWTGVIHDQAFVSGATLTVAGTGPSGSDCGFAGPIANAGAGAGTIDNQRCTDDTATPCTNASGGTGGACAGLGTCEFYWGPPMPISVGGIGICIVDRIAGPVTGTVDTTSGELTRALPIRRSFYSPVSYDAPCPRCVGDLTPNDGGQGGVCSGGDRNGLACDANGTTPAWPDSGATSLDCPPGAASTIAAYTVTLPGTTGTSSLTLTAASPNCTYFAGPRCACDTCNNAGQQVCATNADCPPSGGNPGVCGGRRCLGGANHGGPCGGAGGGVSACPGGGACGRPGEGTRPNACYDNTATPEDGTSCAPALGPHEGMCPDGPVMTRCAVASGHPQRGCTLDNHCCDDAPDCIVDPVTLGDCEARNRPCFLDNGVIGGSIVSDGAADPPIAGVAMPTVAQVFCVPPTVFPALNVAAGLPGPSRLKLVETMELLP